MNVRFLRCSAITIAAISALLLSSVQGRAQATEKVLHKFPGTSPQGRLNFDSQGHLYGNLATGTNVKRSGTVFELKLGSKGVWNEKVLYRFTGGTDGGWPNGNMIFDSVGNLYGTGAAGGSGAGIVFELVAGPNNTWTEKVLYSFSGGSDGSGPGAGLIFDAAGNLYGTTVFGGTAQGTVFQLSPGPNGWTETVLRSFSEADGLWPSGDLVFDAAGNLYGTAFRAGPHDGGTVFELSPDQNGGWSFRVLYAFCSKANCADGSTPAGRLVFDRAGNLYGTTREGGIAGANCNNTGCGTVFELVHKPTGAWTHKVVYAFTGGSDGWGPSKDLSIDGADNLFGTAVGPQGSAFELTPGPNNTRHYNLLYSFCSLPECADGEGPGSVILDGAGNLYGLAFRLAFEITP